ncbi:MULTISPECIES: sugar O-acetyltransferase [Lacticaseibacillus]|uniref:Acetyltransferase n=2 Tax=Lacticaseibacillus TaxID=2759736 RepID=A0AAN1C5K7_LACCA|nr:MULTISPECIES: sugar O-acetyltransferase [Lacticaseibacillus]ARY90248.1 maltose acetyltransferase [Lacticaseibacillus casei]KAB1970010.1 sugar O-acetyltransferase [Lacticaseibacillus casei]WLV80861.1 sugar O-acetyltransferase [Lacticaseibacillus sp. NCIMB 15473]WNX24822.1 sugar O-acetyltransferase [Lacticaseibacillus casei]WNX27594.1 sugar O-acetyltransferase [Lacticaseibacillus casei]
MTIQEKMHNGALYQPMDADLQKEQLADIDEVAVYNRIPATHQEERFAQLKKMFAEIGERSYVEAPFYSNFGGAHVHFGSGIYANFNLTLVDDTHIYVGDRTMFGPNVTLVTATHPIDPSLREQGYQYNKPIHVGRNCWFGANVTVMPGVTIGDNSVIGAGSLVTHDIPANVVAFGSPCRVVREITDDDRKTYDHGKPIDIESL